VLKERSVEAVNRTSMFALPGLNDTSLTVT
jgi:hypothetical protein